MYRVVFAPEAERQLVDLYKQLAAVASTEVADAFVGAIIESCESLRTIPMRGTLREDIRPGLHTFGFRKWVMIAFEVSRKRVTILGVFYGGRDLPSAFEE